MRAATLNTTSKHSQTEPSAVSCKKTSVQSFTLSPMTHLIQHALSRKTLLSPALLLAGISSLVLIAPTVAQAESNTLDAITVTAEKRDADVMDVSSSVSAKTEIELQDAEIASIVELSQHTPNLHIFTWGGSRENNIFIRGIGPGLFTDPTVGFYVDGVNYTSNGMFDLDLADIERVEVLRGPQGTLYGGNSLAGIINVITKKPGNYTEGKLTFSADSLDQRKLGISASTPLIEDELFVGVSLSKVDNSGHLDNIYNGKDYGGREDTNARLKFLWQPTDTLETNLILDYQKLRGDSYALGSADFIKKNPKKVDHNFDGENNRDSKGLALSVTKSFDGIDFTSVTGWRDWDSLNSADQDAGSMDGYMHHSESDEEQSQISQEFRWASTDNQPLQWLAGLYAYKSEYKVDGLNTLDYTAFGMGGPYADRTLVDKDNSGYAAFGQLDYDINDRLTLTAGLRLDKEKRKADIETRMQSAASVDIKGEKNFTEWLPKLGASYTLENDALLYTTVSKGYRAGGFDHLYPSENDPTYESETSTNYELGYKSSFMDGSLELSAALFYIDIKDQQVQQLVPTTGTILTDNAGKGRSQGLEFESRYTPAEGWLISLGGSYTKAEYKSYSGCDFTGMVSNCNGNKMVNTPELTANIAIQNRHPLTENLDLFSRIDVQHIGDYYFDSLNKFKQDSYQLVNLKMGVEAENWEAYAWVKNATDEYYSSVEFDFGAGHTVEAGDPRSYGMTLSTRF